jgi:hypothetical protein
VSAPVAGTRAGTLDQVRDRYGDCVTGRRRSDRDRPCLYGSGFHNSRKVYKWISHRDSSR